jgi:nitroimidazol reductase NimA-like FMN-containing flavoprotein (pyridoxamine 5'-phosphate oxidase superfamily)
MRRHDRDASTPEQIGEVLAACAIGRIGLIDAGVPYIVPVHFAVGAHPSAGATSPSWQIYFHGAKSGHKIDLIGEGARAGFEADRLIGEVMSGDACNTTSHYESVIGHGRAEVVTDPSEKRRALSLIAQKYTPSLNADFTDRPVDFVAVVRLTLDWATAKRHLPDARRPVRCGSIALHGERRGVDRVDAVAEIGGLPIACEQ